MDSRIAADALARDILEKLVTLERLAGARAHHRILDPPHLASHDPQHMQQVARSIADGIGMRNSEFTISYLADPDGVPGFQVLANGGEFHLDLPREATASPANALACLAREIARAYLHRGNIWASTPPPAGSPASIFPDVAAVFLGLGKLLLNADPPPHGERAGQTPQGYLHPAYVAFTFRVVCSMRGVDWRQNTHGLHATALAQLHYWDPHEADLFSLSFRNVLTSGIPHRPLEDAIHANLRELARFDQLVRWIQVGTVNALQGEWKDFHLKCHEALLGMRAGVTESYDPSLVFLLNVQRKMDLQGTADHLLGQRQHLLRRLEELVEGVRSLQAHGLLSTSVTAAQMSETKCPVDGTVIKLPQDAPVGIPVICPVCQYEFPAAPGKVRLEDFTASRTRSALHPAFNRTEVPTTAGNPAEAALDPSPTGGDNSPPSVDPGKQVPLMEQLSHGLKGWPMVLAFVSLGAFVLAWCPLLLALVYTAVSKSRQVPFATPFLMLGIVGSLLFLCGACAVFIMALMKIMKEQARANAPVPEVPDPGAPPMGNDH